MYWRFLFPMNKHTIEFKQNNMLCHRCVMNVVKALSQLPDIEELDVSLETKIIKIKFNDENVSKEMIENIVNESIVNRTSIEKI